MQSQTYPTRPWHVIAAEVTQEKDSGKLLKLVEELNRALAQQCPPVNQPLRSVLTVEPQLPVSSDAFLPAKTHED